jgi:hypothetical protein
MRTIDLITSAEELAKDGTARIREAKRFQETARNTNARDCLELAKLRLKVAQANVDSAIREIKGELKEDGDKTGNLFPGDEDQVAKTERAQEKITPRRRKAAKS